MAILNFSPTVVFITGHHFYKGVIWLTIGSVAEVIQLVSPASLSCLPFVFISFTL